MDKLVEEKLFKILMIISLGIVIGSLFMVIAIIIWNGAHSLSISMITQTPKGGYYLGKGEVSLMQLWARFILRSEVLSLPS